MYQGTRDRDQGYFRPRPSFAPVKVGEEITVKIEAVGAKGDGIAKKNGFVIFVPGVKQDENVKIRITKVLRKVGFAEVVGRGAEAGQPAEEGAAPSEESPSGESSSEEGKGEKAESSDSEEDMGDSEEFGEDEQEAE